jgi:hypothetical protein
MTPLGVASRSTAAMSAWSRVATAPRSMTTPPPPMCDSCVSLPANGATRDRCDLTVHDLGDAEL